MSRSHTLITTFTLILTLALPESAIAATHRHAHPRVAGLLASPCQGTGLTPSPENLRSIRAATLCLINQERARNNELPLRVNRHLQRAAQSHTRQMLTEDYFAHISPVGETPVQRARASGYIPNSQVGYAIGENIAWGTLSFDTPQAIVQAWIASPEHLANILENKYQDTGIGVEPAVPASLSDGQPGGIYSQYFGVIVK